MKKIRHIFTLGALALLIASCGHDNSSQSSASEPTPYNDADDPREEKLPSQQGPDQGIQNAKNQSSGIIPTEDEENALAEEYLMIPVEEQAKPEKQLASQPNTTSAAKTQLPYESDIRHHLENLDDDASQICAHIDALTARHDEYQRQGVGEISDMQMEIVNAYNELINIKNEQIALAIQLGDTNLEQGYRAQLSAFEKALHDINSVRK